MVHMPHWPIPHKIPPTRVDLAPMLSLMEVLDNPHLKLPPVIHVAGTNGKGSTVAYLKAIFESAGKKVHAYTSPHLIEFNERIVLAGEKIFDDHLFQLVERVRMAATTSSASPLRYVRNDGRHNRHSGICEANIRNAFDTENSPTFFEATTAAAFLAFSETPADILLVETGLGGRLDATNILNPILTIITPISYDHMPILGPTLPIIAAEKAGIIKSGVPCIINAQVEDVMDVFLNRCEEVGSEAIAYGYDFAVDKESDGMMLHSGGTTTKYPLPALPGDHQIMNSSAVIMACERLGVDYEHICEGLRKAEWPGRLQRVEVASLREVRSTTWQPPSNKSEIATSPQVAPRNNDIHIWLDGAHNPGGAQVLAIWMDENLSKPISLILGMTKNRDSLTFASFFKGIVDRIYCVRVFSEPSSYSSTTLAELVAPSGIEVIACDNVEEAVKHALKASAEVVVTGSLFLVADVLKMHR